MMNFYYGDDRYNLAKATKPLLKNADVYDEIPENLGALLRSTGLFTTHIVLRLTDLKALDITELTGDVTIILLGIPDKRLKVFKHLNKVCDVQSFILPKDWDTRAITKLIKGMAQDKNIEVSEGAIAKLIEHYHSDTLRISTELDKLSNAFSGTIDISMIQDLEDCSTVIFNLVEHILKSDSRSILDCLKLLELQGENEFKVLSILSKQFNDHINVKLNCTQGLPPWKVQKLRTSVTLERLIKLNLAALSAMTSIKQGKRFNLTVWVLSL
jgi:DNA polymerase III delta subunit